MSYTANEICDRVQIKDIYAALGGQIPRRGNRYRCLVHRGDNETVSVNESRGVWNCFGCNRNGGKVALVRYVLNCEPKAALEWLANLAGMSLAQASREEQRAHAAALQEAEDEGRRLVAWRTGLIAKLREQRECFQTVYWMGIRIGMDQRDEEWLWGRIREYDQKIIWHEQQPWSVMTAIYRNSLEPQSAVARYRKAA